MIKPSEAKELYGFRDANDREDVLTMNLLNSVQAVVERSALRAVEAISPLIIVILCILMGIYASQNGMKLSMIALPFCMLLVYVPRIKELITQKKDSSGLRFDPKTMGSHFLVGYGTCLEKTDCSSAMQKTYRIKVKLQNGAELEDVIIVRQFYERIKEGQKVFVAMADSPQAQQLIGILPQLYDIKIIKDQDDAASSPKPDSRKLRRILDDERQYCAAYFSQNRKSLISEQQRNRSLVFLLPAVILVAVSFLADAVLPMDLAIVLFASYILMMVFDFLELNSLLKSIQSGEDVFVLDATVSDKPLLQSQQARHKGKTQAIDFKDRSGKLVFRSRKIEDWRPLNIGDEVLLVYIGKKSPLACLKPARSLNSGK